MKHVPKMNGLNGMTGYVNGPWSYTKTAMESLKERLENSCNDCCFKGKEPLIAIYPEKNDTYAFLDNADSWTDIAEAISAYLECTSSEFKTREAAEDALQQMFFKITDYLDHKLGRTSREKMAEYQRVRMSKIFGKIKPEEYKEKYETWMKRYDADCEEVLGMDDIVEFAAKNMAQHDEIKKLAAEIKFLQNELKVKDMALDEAKRIISEKSNKIQKNEEAHSKQVKGLMKEIKSLEAEIRKIFESTYTHKG